MKLATRKIDGQCNFFFTRGMELASLGSSRVDSELRSCENAYSHEEYLVKINKQEYHLGYDITRGRWNERTFSWNERSIVNVGFRPDLSDNLRFVKDSEVKLPSFEVYRELGEFYGFLHFDRRHVERRHWWSRLYDQFIQGDQVADYIGSACHAGGILANLNKRLAADPTSILPINPEQWQLYAQKRAGIKDVQKHAFK